jgi:CO/xanthine dehydrogenase FAD-binding subunit
MPQLKAYHRPTSLDEALQFLTRTGSTTAVIGGGTHVTVHLPETVEELVDLQAIPELRQIEYIGQKLTLGAMVRLEEVVDSEQVPALLRETAHREGPNTLRNAATVGGTVIRADKESEFLAALLVFEAEVHIQTTHEIRNTPLTKFLQDVPVALDNGLVTGISLRATPGKTASDRVGRTPADKPIVAAVAHLADDGQLRLALCGVAETPILVEPENIKAAISAPNDFRGSSEYRRQVAATLAKRVIKQLSADQ